MSNAAAGNRPAKPWFIRGPKLILAGLGLAMLALLATAGFFGLLRSGSLPQYVAQLLLEFFGPDIALILLAAAIILAWQWWRKRGGVALAAAILSLAGAIACAFTLAGYVAVANANGVSINLVRALLLDFPSGPSPAHTYVYDLFDGKDVTLLAYPPETGKRPAPILMHVHGGGWVQGSAVNGSADQRWFASQGYLVVDVNYALSSDQRHLWNVTQPQLGCALAWIANNARRLGGDPGRIALYGESAGGNLALDVAHLANAGKLPSRCGGKVPRVSAVISLYGPVDLAAIYANKPTTIYALSYLGGSPSQYPDRYASVSPISYVNGPGAPTLLVTGLDDGTVPAKDILRYAALRRASGHDIQLIALPRAGHEFDAVPGSIGNQLVRQSILHFLARHGLQP